MSSDDAMPNWDIDLDTGCYTLVRKNPGTRDNILDADADMHIRMIRGR